MDQDGDYAALGYSLGRVSDVGTAEAGWELVKVDVGVWGRGQVTEGLHHVTETRSVVRVLRPAHQHQVVAETHGGDSAKGTILIAVHESNL